MATLQPNMILLLILLAALQGQVSTQAFLSQSTSVVPERPVLSSSGSQSAEWKHIRIKTFYDSTVNRLPTDQQKLIKCVLVGSAVEWIEKAIQVHPTSTPVRFERNCQSNFQYLVGGESYCSGDCTPQTKCGPTVIPTVHLNGCRSCSNSINGGKKCKQSPTYIFAGVSDADFVVYVSVSTSPFCRGLASGSHCQQDHRGRPVGGYLTFCSHFLADLTASASMEPPMQQTLHQLIHAMVFSEKLFPYYRDSQGNRYDVEGKLPDSESVVLAEFNTAWSARIKLPQFQRFIITPAVQRTVREHFGCASALGAELEGDGGIGAADNHWEERLFSDDTMSFHHQIDEGRGPSKLTLALFEDSGWYLPNYDFGVDLKWGRGKGCGFINDSCLGWIQHANTKGIETAPFCTESDVKYNKISCSTDRKSLAKCNLINWPYDLPTTYQYFNTTAGGSLSFADYCPLYQPYLTCEERSNVIGLNYALETFGSQSLCVQHTSAWSILDVTGRRLTSPQWGAGCYDVKCGWSKGQMVVLISLDTDSSPLLCKTSGETLKVSQRVGENYFTGSLVCPDIEDMCNNMECLNFCSSNGHCKQGKCHCYPGYFGLDCSQHHSEALLDCSHETCLNGGTCVNTPCGSNCTCAPGFSGSFCENPSISIPPCLARNCSNHGVCYYSSDGFTPLCGCDSGYTGAHCEQTVDHCALSGNPCKNDGTCENTPQGYRCICRQYYSGSHCGSYQSPCSNNPCRNYGQCEPSPDSPLGFICHCSFLWRGPHCELFRICSRVRCSNGGTCKEPDYVGDTNLCICPPAFKGRFCTERAGACDSVPCLNGATCNELSGLRYQCTCADGFTGDNCEHKLDPCRSSPCQNLGTCIQLASDSFLCNCTKDYSGAFCQVKVSPCDSSPCQNGGLCVRNATDDFLCNCTSDFSGQFCEQKVDPCDSSPCRNGGLCVRNATDDFFCNCTSDFSGQFCEQKVDPCDSSPCRNGGLCVRNATDDFFCNCTSDFSGQFCEQKVDPCDSSPCQNGGLCTISKLSSEQFHCNCTNHFQGIHCEMAVGPCHSSPCLNGAICLEMMSNNTFTCTCEPGYHGDFCQSLDPCFENPCGENGSCSISLENDFVCACNIGWIGTHCNLPNLCELNPCMNNGTCHLTTLNQNNGSVSLNSLNISASHSHRNYSYICKCEHGYHGSNCKYIDMCVRNTKLCGNNGSCLSLLDGGYACEYAVGYTSANCEHQLPCILKPCRNDSVCYSVIKRYNSTTNRTTIQVSSNWTTASIGSDAGLLPMDFMCACADTYPCFHNGSCTAIEPTSGLSYTRACDHGHSGQHCEEDLVKPCSNIQCHNNGSCVNLPNNTALCVCAAGFTGDFCDSETTVGLCELDPCVEGECSTNDTTGSGTICSCPPQSSGKECDELLPQGEACTSMTCQHGGTCISTASYPFYVCACLETYTGLQCETHNPCANQPCLNGGRCFALSRSWRHFCSCRPGFSGVSCEQQTTCPIGHCLNGGTCILSTETGQHSCKCTKTFEGTNCQSVRKHPCNSDPCGNGACIEINWSNYTCDCNVGFNGPNCEQLTQRTLLDSVKMQGGDSYLLHQFSHTLNSTNLNVTIAFRSSVAHTLLLHMTDTTNTWSCMLTQLRGRARFQVFRGHQRMLIVSIRKQMSRLLNGWHALSLVWQEDKVMLDVSGDQQRTFKTRHIDPPVPVLKFTTAFVGGLPNGITTLLRKSSGSMGMMALKGCLSHFTVNGEIEKFAAFRYHFRGVERCMRRVDPCMRRCSDGQECLLQSLQFVCLPFDS